MTVAVAPAAPPGTPLQPHGTNGVAPVLASGGPTRYRWTIAEYRKLGEFEAFQRLRTILLDGEILVVPPPNPPHNTALALTEAWLRGAFPVGHYVRNQMGFDVGTENDPGPDLAVVVGSIRDYTSRNPDTAALIVEVAESSLSIDTRAKAELYAVAGVKDYWVIDLVHRQLLVYRDPVSPAVGLGGAAYSTRLAFGPAESVAPLAAPQATVAVAELLP